MSDKNVIANLEKKDLRKSFWRWVFTAEIPNSYERLQALSVCGSLSNILKKLYPDKEELSEALKRHLQFFNSEVTFGSLILGIICSMEEEKAQGGNVPGETITSLKTGLMGPMAGIGDTLIHGISKPIIYGLCASLALQGNVGGAFLTFAYTILGWTVAYNLWMLGYRVGKTSIKSILSSGMINSLITGASILGLFMMGALGSSYVKLSIPLEIVSTNAQPIIVQEILDKILPGLLPLGCIMGIYYFFKWKGQKYNVVLLGIIIISMLGALIGIF